MSWLITWVDGSETQAASRIPPASENSPERARYLALLGLLSVYVAQGGSGPLHLSSSNRLLRHGQSTKATDHPVVPWCQVDALIEQIPHGIHEMANWPGGWVPAMAGEAIYAEAPPELVNSELLRQIARLNAHGVATWQEYQRLRLQGRDAYSRMSYERLAQLVGPKGVERILTAFLTPAQTHRSACKAALRWMARGLAAHLAVEKVHLEAMHAERRARHG